MSDTADLVDTQDIALLRASGALLVNTPHFIRSESGASTPPTAPRTLLDAGLPIADGTDTTGTVPKGASPLYNVWFASAPRPLSRDRDQRLDRVEALSLFTSWAADAAAGQPDRGRLRPRMLGDLAVLSQNPLDVPTDRLPDITVDATIVGGKVAYHR